MSLIVAGTFDQKNRADQVVDTLLRSGMSEDSVCLFAINPAGQHAALPIGGDHHASSGAGDAGVGAATGAAIGSAVGLGIGLATAPITGPVGPLSGAAVGAYVGSLAGALNQLEDRDEKDGEKVAPAAQDKPVRASGVMVAVDASQSLSEALAISVLRRYQAKDIERVPGVWRNGVWEDFDPATAPQLMSEPH
jgi:hypothetical protein